MNAPRFKIRRLTGRCSNGYERDAGSRNHAVPTGSHVAVCGATYGRRSAGWSEYEEEEITCPRCLKKIKSEQDLYPTTLKAKSP